MSAPNFKIDPHASHEQQPSKLIPTACFTTAETDEISTSFYNAADGSVAAGVWECPPCKIDIGSYPVNEMMTIISGALTITNADGLTESFGPGEVVFAAKGAKMTWEITSRLKKYYMTSA